MAGLEVPPFLLIFIQDNIRGIMPMSDEIKKITAEIKLASQALITHSPSTVQAFEGTDNDGFFRYQKRLEDYSGEEVELVEVNLPGYSYQVKDVEGLYLRSDWVTNVNVEIFWNNVLVDTPVKVKQNPGDGWTNANFARYDADRPGAKIAVWANGRNSHTSPSEANVTWFVIGELA
jgi:hypothetical protein